MRQDKQVAMNKSVGLLPKRVFGLRTDVIGNVHFTLGQDVVYPVAGAVVVQDFITNEQKHLRFEENIKPEIIVISPNLKLLAVSEVDVISEKAVINIYELEKLKKIKTLNLPPECPVQNVGNMCFTCDSKGLAMLSQEPDAFITIYTFDKSDGTVTGRASNKNYPGRATLVQCNPSDASIVTIGGENMLKIMNKTEKGFGQLGTIKGENIVVTSLTWLTAEIIIAGSAEMELYFIEGGELKVKYNTMDLEFIDLALTPDEKNSKSELSTIATLLAKKVYPIKCLTTFPLGFAFATSNMCHVFRRLSALKFQKKTLLTVPVTLFEEALYVIKDIAINDQQDTIVATTEHSQIFIGQLFAPENMNVVQTEFKYLGEPLHVDSIIDLSVCSWKPIAMTASKDHTVRIWNYNTMKVELIKKFLIDIRVVALHPSGIFAAIGFVNVLRLFQIQLNDLKISKSFNYPMCSVIKFSHRGHLLAAGCEKIIAIICVFTFETVMTLKGHNGILSLAWSMYDRFIVSSGKEGSVYEWNVSNNGERVNELVQKGTHYNAIAVSSDQSYIVAVTHSAYLREISKSQMIREYRAPDNESSLTTLAFARSDQIMFAANERGSLYNIKMPFLESGGGSFNNNHFYHKAINRLCMTHDDKLLVSVGKDGTLVFWTITNIENRVTEVIDAEIGSCEDILISRGELTAKIDKISLLEMRINEQIDEFSYEKFQSESSYKDQIKGIHEKYGNELEHLKKENETLKVIHTEQLNEVTEAITKSNERHQREVDELESNFNQKIILEFDNQKILIQQMQEMKENYEQKLSKSNCILHDTKDNLERKFKKQLDEKQDFVDGLSKKIKEKEKEFEEYCRQEILTSFHFVYIVIEIDDRNMVESQLSYEKRLKDSEEIITRWRGDAGVLKKKNSNMTKECEELRKEIELLRSQQSRFQDTIMQNQKQLDELRIERNQRDVTIKEKEKHMMEMMKQSQELETNKQILTTKMNELRNEIEPREVEIREKKERIFEMEREIKLLQQQQLNSGLKISQLRDKLLGSDKELKVEKTRSKNVRDQLTKICSDIHKISSFIQQSPEKLKEQVTALFHRYGSDAELQKTLLLDVEVQNEFARQREYYEKLLTKQSSSKISGGRSKKLSGSDHDTLKLLRENVTLITELNRLRTKLNDVEKENDKMKSILGLTTRHMLPSVARQKLDKAAIEKEEIHENYREIIEKLEEKLEKVIAENESLRSKAD
ncbi:CLUMA_CG009126, isoform A [Clunio marinus]|uniref:CLUMA_CG009126, isoform A n=1 Tax=Clunio marinus TaxID=568069 RepID=A0A1J1I7W4_9DIPT|nr:CLUMA_CG009126, isoform A [Clunio marinus]